MDLVKAGEELIPGSSTWMTAPIWALSARDLPTLEDVRSQISELKELLGVVTREIPSSSLSDLACVELADDAEVTGSSDETSLEDQQAAIYAESLEMFTESPSPLGLSLMDALVIESFITDQDRLYEIHHACFVELVDALFAHPLMSEVRGRFDELVGVTCPH